MAYYNKVTGVTVPFVPADFDWRWQFVPDPITTNVNSSGTAKDTSKTNTNSKSSFWDGFGGVVSALTASLPSVLGAFGIGSKTPTTQTQVTTGTGSAPASGSGSAGAGSGKDNGGSFNWTTLLLPVIGIVVIVLLITKK